MHTAAHTAKSAFQPGTIVLASLSNPREKFWGAILEISVAGISLRGIDLGSFDDVVRSLRNGEPTAASDVFFPMHRLERLEVDSANNEIPSLSERFEGASGSPATTFLVVQAD